MDIGTIVATAIGGAIGLSGELMGRTGAKRQAERARREVLEDAQRSRVEVLQDSEREAQAQRARTSADRLRLAFAENTVFLHEAANDQTKKSAIRIMTAIASEKHHFFDPGLRRRLSEIDFVLDLAVAGVPVCGYTLPELVFMARVEVSLLLGAWYRGEELPSPDDGWKEVREAIPGALADWEHQLQTLGLKFTRPKLI